MAIFELVEEITTAMDNSMSTVAVFIDLKKAFDRVDHNILLDKLEHYGIRGFAFSWIQSYLTNRTQYVSINDTNSTCINVYRWVARVRHITSVLNVNIDARAHCQYSTTANVCFHMATDVGKFNNYAAISGVKTFRL